MSASIVELELLEKANADLISKINTLDGIISALQDQNKALNDELVELKKSNNNTDQNNAVKALIASHDHIVAMLGVIVNSVSKLQLEVILAKGNVVTNGEQKQDTTVQ
jgi:hypothetical protein